MTEYAMLAAGYRTEVAALTGPLLLRSVGRDYTAAATDDDGGAGLGRHRRFWPELRPAQAQQLVAATQQAKLTGRGGAEFPFWRKLQAALDAGRRRELVVNGSEGEPASAKDSTLLTAVPHLVLDGAQLVAEALGVQVVHVMVPGSRPVVIEAVRRAIAERSSGALGFEVHPTSGGFVGGQSRAVLELISGRENLPVTSWQPEAMSGLRGKPTLMSNAETFAHVAALHGVGQAGYAGVGTSAEPGSRLLSVAADGPGGVVLEVPHGTALVDVLRLCGYEPDQPVLLGGYHGSWLSVEQVQQATISPSALAPFQARLGAGVVLPMLPGDCPVTFTAQIVGYLAQRRARRCGPCLNGLPALAAACERLAQAGSGAGIGAGAGALARVRELCGLVTGRGACQHPDGTARLALSMLNTFPGEATAHDHGTCLLA